MKRGFLMSGCVFCKTGYWWRWATGGWFHGSCYADAVATRVLTYVPIVGIKHGHLQTLFSDLLMNTPTTLPGCAGRVGQRGEAKLWE